MIVYWVMFLFPAMLALSEKPEGRKGLSPAWLVALVGLTIVIGFRWSTGGDWGNYYQMVEDEAAAPEASDALSDPAFKAILHLASGSPVGILLVTAISGLMMGIALTRFSLKQPRPWLAMAVAIPYLVVVMGMGYIRQGMAISCLMMGLATIEGGKIIRYSLWVLFGALFHSTAVIMLPLGALVSNRNMLIRGLLILLALAFLVYGMRSSRADELVNNYVNAEMSSSGAAIRLLMTALPACLFLRFRNRFTLDHTERGIWTLLCGASIFAFLIFFASPSSTVVDRLGLYLLPVQCFVYSRVPSALSQGGKNERTYVIAILALYAVAFFVWLNFANNAGYWIPYRSYFMEDKICLQC